MGASLLYFRCHYPRARIIGVEPDPHTFQQLQRNVEQLDVDVRGVAITAADGDVAFYPSRQSWASSLYPNGSAPVVVKGRSLDSLLDDLKLRTVDLLKVDIEGAELEVLTASERLSDIRTIVGELHCDSDRAPLTLALNQHFDTEVEAAVNSRPTFVSVNRTFGARRP
jgi:FkbM family methyltransferase